MHSTLHNDHAAAATPNLDADRDEDASVTPLTSALVALELSAPQAPLPPRTLHLFLDLDGCIVLDEASCGWAVPPRPRPFLAMFLATAFHCCASVSLWTAAGSSWLARVRSMIHEQSLLPAGAFFLLEWSGNRCRQRANLAAIEAGDFYARRLPSKPLLKAWRRGAGRRAGMKRHNTLIVDDTPSTYRDNYGNALPISSFDALHQEAHDDELRRLASFLPVLAALPDIRSVEKRGWSHRYAVHAHQTQSNDSSSSSNESDTTGSADATAGAPADVS